MTPYSEFEDAFDSLRTDSGVRNSVLSLEQTSWILFLKYLYCCEQKSQSNGSSTKSKKRSILDGRYCWSNWACPKLANGKTDKKRQMEGNDLIEFVNGELFPYLKEISDPAFDVPEADPKSNSYRIGNIFHYVPNRVESGRNLRKMLDFVDTIDFNNHTVMQEFSRVFEGQLEAISMNPGRANEYYTPRPLIRSIIRSVDPKIGETVYDPGFGTCGFLTETFGYFSQDGKKLNLKSQRTLQNDTFYGYDKSPSIYLIGLINMIIHGIEFPCLRRDSVLRFDVRNSDETSLYDVVLGNLPSGRKVDSKLLNNFPIRHKSVEILYLQHVMNSIKPNGRAAVVLPEYFMGKADKAYKRLRKELLENFDLHTVLCLPERMFWPYMRMKTNVLFFNRKGSTSNVWYYDSSLELQKGEGNGISDDHFSEFLSLIHSRATTERSWLVPIESFNNGCDLSPKNPSKMVDGRVITKQQTKVKQLKHLLEETSDLLVGYLDNRFESADQRMLFGELIKVNQGVSLPKGEKTIKSKTRHPYLKVDSFTELGTIDLSELKFLSQKAFNEIKPKTISEFDLYVSVVKPIGLSGIVPPELSGAVLSADAVILSIKDGKKLDLRYLYLYTLTSDFVNGFDNAVGGGLGEDIELAKVKEIEIPICPIEEQLKLVEAVWPYKGRINEAIEFVKKEISDDEDSVNEYIQKLTELKLKIEKLLTEDEQFTEINTTKLASPFSTGNGGAHFEAQVQSYFVTLMLANGQIPCLPSGQIEEIMLQGRVDGYNTDDIIVFTQHPTSLKKFKLLGQIKHTIRISKGSSEFGKVINAAWKDFNNSDKFEKFNDAIALMTGPMTGTDRTNAGWLLNQAKAVRNSSEYFKRVKQAHFSPAKCAEKLDAIRFHLIEANEGQNVSDEEVFEFLKHFHLIEFDFESETGVLHSTLLSLISQFSNLESRETWSLVVNSVFSFNKRAGSITRDSLPKDLQDAFQRKEIEHIPDKLKNLQKIEKMNWSELPHGNLLAKLALVGSWSDENDNDRKIIEKLLNLKYPEFLNKASDIISIPNSPLAVKNNNWTITQKERLLKKLGEKIFMRDMKKFEKISKSVLGETSPVFDLPEQDRISARIHGNAPKYSDCLCKGISDGLAILSNRTEFFKNCSASEVKRIPVMVLGYVLKDSDWRNWCTLNEFLPILAESAPDEFLSQVKTALTKDTNPIDAIFRQERDGLTGVNYMTGILWGLETIAWEKEKFVSVCEILGELAVKDPGGNWANRPFNSLVTILLPWFPQTKASSTKRTSAVTMLLKERPELGWKLLLNLLPYKKTASIGSRIPIWRTNGTAEFKKRASQKEFLDESNNYSILAVKEAVNDSVRISELISCMNFLSMPAVSKFISMLNSTSVRSLPESERTKIWEKLKSYVTSYQRNQDSKIAVTEEQIGQIEEIIQKIIPEVPYFKFQRLFSHREYELYASNGNLENQRTELLKDRINAVKVILDRDGLKGIMRFSNEVESPEAVGRALASATNKQIDDELLSNYLTSEEDRLMDLVRSFVFWKCSNKGWKWVDSVRQKSWSHRETGRFLAYLPFESNTWDRVQSWLNGYDYEYWKLINGIPGIPKSSKSMNLAIEKLIQHGRTHTAINCLHNLLISEQSPDCELTVQALLANVNSSEIDRLDRYRIKALIKFLQSKSDLDENSMVKVEWAYLPMLDGYKGVSPIAIESKLATDPEFFCSMIQLIYRSKHKGNGSHEVTESQKKIAMHAYEVLWNWKKVPGSDANGQINPKKFESWLNQVKEICKKSGHLQVALNAVGRVLAHSPTDTSGLWINRTVANALNERDNDDLRSGYRIGDTGDEIGETVDLKCAKQKKRTVDFQEKADQIENEGFHRFATTLRSMADSEQKQAEIIASLTW